MSIPDPAQTNPLDAALGQRVRQRRKALGLSQVRLADGIGVSFQQIQKYERGVNRISFSTIVLIARVLQCSAAELIDGIDGARSPDRIALTPEETELLEAFSAIAAAPLRSSTLALIKQMAVSCAAER